MVPWQTHSVAGGMQVGAKCGAFRTLLTHFSQRYPKIPVMDPSFEASTCIASDLMRINFGGAWTLHQPCLPCCAIDASLCKAGLGAETQV